jgi:Caspase domain
MRKALIVGIDYYDRIPALGGCVNDANAVKSVLERHADGTTNFTTPEVLLGAKANSAVTRQELKEAVRQLFSDDADIALLYFAGHGYTEDTGGFLCASDCETGDDGLPLAEVMTFANKSQAKNKVIVLDSCHSGIAGDSPIHDKFAEVAEGMTILSASGANQYALEVPEGGAGVFTSLFIHALQGAAANLVGDVTPGSVYSHIDQSLGPWSQRPVFKTNVKRFVSLRRAQPPIPLDHLRAVTKYFPTPDHRLPLDPSYEPERSPDQLANSSIPPPDPAKTAVFAVLQEQALVNMVRPVGALHMWHAAMQSKACELTVLGQHYWNLVDKGLL